MWGKLAPPFTHGMAGNVQNYLFGELFFNSSAFDRASRWRCSWGRWPSFAAFCFFPVFDSLPFPLSAMKLPP
jgi:hypothetical protein